MEVLPGIVGRCSAPKLTLPEGTLMNMNKLTISAIALAISLAFSAGAMAAAMSKADYKADKDKISDEYKSAKAGCASLSGNAKDICVAEVKGKEKVAKAELEAIYQPTVKNHYEVRVVKAEAVYEVAKQKCDDLSGNPKHVCVKEAKAVEASAKADAKAQMKTTDAHLTANEKTAEAHSDANAKTAEARKDATIDKRDAEYAVAKEKCDTFSGNAKDQCLDQAKGRFSK
jgi:hypothetical protein